MHQTCIHDYCAWRTAERPALPSHDAIPATHPESNAAVLHAEAVLQCASAALIRATQLVNLDTGSQGSPSETAAARALYRELSAEVERIGIAKRRVSALKEAYAALDEELSALRRSILRQLILYRSLLTPVQRLPLELLSYIFTCATDLHDPLDRIDFAGTLACVCDTWRAVAYSTPSLWTHIGIEHISAETCTVDVRLLSMSGVLPLVIYHDCAYVHDGLVETELRLEQLLISLKSHSTRWGSLTLHAPSWLFGDLNAIELPSLQEAIFEIDCFVYDSQLPRILDFLAQSPSLRRLEVAAYGTDSYSEDPKSTFALPALRRLATLSLDMRNMHVSGPETFSNLTQCATSITQLKLSVRLTHALAGHVHLPVLRVLELGSSAARILAHITTPHLEELSVNKTLQLQQWDPMPMLLAFLTRTQQLRRLTLGDVYTEDRTTFLDCMEHMDDLRELCVIEDMTSSPLLTQEALARMTCVDAPASLQPVEEPALPSPEDSPTSLPSVGKLEPLLPSLTAIKVMVRMSEIGQWTRTGSRIALYEMLASRRETRVRGTRVVAALENLETIVDTEWDNDEDVWALVAGQRMT